MRVVVTGAASFIGKAVIKELEGRGCQVFAVIRPESAGRNTFQESSALKVLVCDLKDIRKLSMDPKLEGHANAWIHLGWEGAGSANRQDPYVQAKNITYTLDALDAASDLGCTRFLFSGSQAEYGISRELMREDAPCHPVSEYGKDKLEVCRRAMEKSPLLGITYLHARIFSVYGPGDHPWSLISTCIDTFLKGGHMELGACTQLWNFLYIQDAARALASLLLAKAPQGVYNVAGEDTRPLKEYIEELHRICGGRGTYEYGIRPPNAEGVVSLMPDTEKLWKTAGFRQQISFEQGIREMTGRPDV